MLAKLMEKEMKSNSKIGGIAPLSHSICWLNEVDLVGNRYRPLHCLELSRIQGDYPQHATDKRKSSAGKTYQGQQSGP